MAAPDAPHPIAAVPAAAAVRSGLDRRGRPRRTRRTISRVAVLAGMARPMPASRDMCNRNRDGTARRRAGPPRKGGGQGRG
jgi:hypothetical protein